MTASLPASTAPEHLPASKAKTPEALHIVSPLLFSSALSRRSGCNVYLKLDNNQPSGSFKTRGVGAAAVAAFREHGEGTELVCSSGGNAGLACAYSARVLGLKCTIVVPLTTSPVMVTRLGEMDAQVIQEGAGWDEADQRARTIVAENPKAAYIHPFEGEDLIKGHASLISELQTQLRSAGVEQPPDAVVCSVGGGGLLCGLLHGMDRDGWENVPLIAAETFGANCLVESLRSSYSSTPPVPRQATIPRITSIATSLGARTPSRQAVEACVRHPGGVVSLVMSDKRAVETLVGFAADHQILVEPACSVCLAPFYDVAEDAIARALGPSPAGAPPRTIVVIVCGGSAVSLDKIAGWQADQREAPLEEMRVERFGGREAS